jgi:hypothetical protein
MSSPGGVEWNFESRTAEDLSDERGRRTREDIWRCVQRGLVYPSPYAVFVTFFCREPRAGAITKPALGRLLSDVRVKIHADYAGAHTTAILGGGFRLWHELSVGDGSPLPLGMSLRFPASDGGAPAPRSEVFTRPGTAFRDSAADLWFHVKSSCLWARAGAPVGKIQSCAKDETQASASMPLLRLLLRLLPRVPRARD